MTILLDPQLLLSEIQQLQAAGNLEAMLFRCQQGVQAFPENEEFHRCLAYAQAHYVEEKLHSTILKELEQKKDYLTLHKVYKKLQEIFPESLELKTLLRKIEKQLKSAHNQERDQYIASAKIAIQSFLDAGKIDEALHACEELLAYAPYDVTVKSLFRKVMSLRNLELNQGMEGYFQKHFDEWGKDCLSRPQAYVQL